MFQGYTWSRDCIGVFFYYPYCWRIDWIDVPLMCIQKCVYNVCKNIRYIKLLSSDYAILYRTLLLSSLSWFLSIFSIEFLSTEVDYCRSSKPVNYYLFFYLYLYFMIIMILQISKLRIREGVKTIKKKKLIKIYTAPRKKSFDSAPVDTFYAQISSLHKFGYHFCFFPPHYVIIIDICVHIKLVEVFYVYLRKLSKLNCARKIMLFFCYAGKKGNYQ